MMTFTFIESAMTSGGSLLGLRILCEMMIDRIDRHTDYNSIAELFLVQYFVVNKRINELFYKNCCTENPSSICLRDIVRCFQSISNAIPLF